MSSHAYLYLDNSEIYHWRNELDHSILSVFTKKDLIEAEGEKALEIVKAKKLQAYEGYEEDEDFSVTCFFITASELVDRLKTLGYGEIAFLDFVNAMVEYNLSFAKRNTSKDMAAHYQKEIKTLEEIKGNLPDLTNLSEDAQNTFNQFLETSPCYTLYHLLADANPDELVTLDISEFAYEGWFDDTYFEFDEAMEELTRSSSMPIVLTEGVFDRKVLKESIELLYPHLAEHIKFLDTDFKTEGGAGAVVKQLKSFAAAGISNRILLILDNDSAAFDAISTLNQKLLPSNYRVMHYPKIDIGLEYPTIGPQGNTLMDINGLAGSIELYLGEDTLRNESGDLRPIQWTGYVKKIGKYQGELLDKSIVQDKFEKKLKFANANSSEINNQDWSGIRLIIEAILTKLSTY